MRGRPPGAGALKPSMGAVGALLLTASGLSPSIGVFVVGSDTLRRAGTSMFLCFVAAGAGALYARFMLRRHRSWIHAVE